MNHEIILLNNKYKVNKYKFKIKNNNFKII